MRLSRPILPRRSLLKDEDGQSLPLAALLVLFVFVAVMVTFSIGHRVREKIKMQALADSAAYSLAVAEARTFNYFAWTNRARVAHDVAILSIQSHISYLSYLEGMMHAHSVNLKWIAGEMALGFLGCEVGWCCTGPADSKGVLEAGKYYDSDEWPAAGWMKKQRDNWDTVIGGTALAHYELIRAIQGEQYKMLAQLTASLGLPLPQTSLAQKLAQSVDGEIHASAAAGVMNETYLAKAIHFPPAYPPMQMKNDADDDWAEIVSATRYPEFVTNRNFVTVSATVWGAYGIAMSKMMPTCFMLPPIENLTVFGSGEAKVISAPPNTFSELQNRIHSDSSDSIKGWSGTAAYAAEDHGGAWTTVGCTTICGGTFYWPASGGVSGDAQNKGIHFFGSEVKKEPKIGRHGFGPADDKNKVYLNHPRFRWGTLDKMPKETWNYPRTLALLTKEMGKAKQVYDFELETEVPIPITFKTRGNEGDKLALDKMAAIGGGLAYYHKPKPRNGGKNDNWKEPPSFWNPFWRAKLHPIDRLDAGKVALVGHPPSAPAVEAINY